MLKNQEKFEIDKNENLNFYFQEHLYIFKYEGTIRTEIIDYKFNEKAYLYKSFVNFILKNEKLFQFLKSYDTIIPVPISKKRKKERGYNQSYLIAKEIAKAANLQLIDNCLIKTKNIVEQSKLDKKQREKNIQGVYKIRNKQSIVGKKIIIFDDIYTTGSTVNECAKTLYNIGVDKIGILTLAKD